jgi:hypothetical protein
MVNGWKVAAVVFGLLLLVETSFIYYAYSSGYKETNNEIICSNDICYKQGYTSYTYADNICNCWEDNVIKYQIPIK